jgi:hypothetical protein
MIFYWQVFLGDTVEVVVEPYNGDLDGGVEMVWIGRYIRRDKLILSTSSILEARNIGPDKPQFTASSPLIKPTPSTHSKKYDSV